MLREIKERYNKISISHAIIIAIAIAAIVFLSSLVAAYLLRPYNSDDVAVQRVLQTMRPGQENHAIVGTDNFLIKAPLYYLMDMLFTNSPVKLLAINLILNTIFFTGMILIVLALCKPYFTSKIRVWLAFIPVIWFLGLLSGDLVPFRVDKSLGTATAFMNPNYRTAETGIILIILASLIYHAAKLRMWVQRVNASLLITAVTGLGAFILLSLFFFSDPFFIYTVGIGAVMTLLLKWIGKDLSGRTLLLASGIIIASASIGKALLTHAIEFLGIIPIENVEKLFVSFPMILENASNSLWSLFILFHSDFWNSYITEGKTIIFISNSILLFTCLFAMYFVLLRFRNQKSRRAILLFFTVTILLNITVFTVTVHGSHIENFRYLFVGTVFMVPLLSYVLMQLNITMNNIRVWLTFIFIFTGSLALNSAMNIKMSAQAFSQTGGQQAVNLDHEKIITILSGEQLTKGYGDYWDANIITYLSNNAVSILPLACTDYKFKQYHWFVNTLDYGRKNDRTFFIRNSDDISNIIKACDPIKQFGTPNKKIIASSRYEIFVYNKDIGRDRQIYIPIAPTSH